MPIAGTIQITGLLAPSSSGDTYAITDTRYGKDGLRNVDTIGDLDTIGEGKRRAGMLVGVPDLSGDTIYYTLKKEPWNYDFNDWGIFNGSGGVSGNYVNLSGDTMTGQLILPSLSATTISGGTYYGDGSNLTGIATGNYVNLSGDTMTGGLITPSLSSTTISGGTLYGDGRYITNIPSLLDPSKTIFLDPVSGNDTQINFVKTMTRARQIIGTGSTIGWSVVCLAGELTEVIDLDIVEYPNQLAGEGLTWVFSPGFTANLSSNETLFLFGNRDINGSVFWQHGCSIIGEYATLNNTGTSSVFDLNGLFVSDTIAIVEVHIKLLNISSTLAPLFVEKFDVLKNSYLGNFIFEAIDVYGDFNIKIISKQIQKSHIKIHKIICSNKFSIEYNPLRVFANGQTFMECVIDIYKIDSPVVLINLGIGLKYDIYIQLIINTTVDTVINAHASYNSVKILNLKNESIIFESLPQESWGYNAYPPKFNGVYQEYVVSSPNDITFYQGFDFDVVYNLVFSCLGNGTINIYSNPNAWSPPDNNRTVNLTLPKPISNLVIENCNVNIITDSVIGSISASTINVDRVIRMDNNITINSDVLDGTLISLNGKYNLKLDNQINLGESMTGLTGNTYGIELLDDSIITLDGGGINKLSNSPFFKNIKNSKLVSDVDIIVNPSGGFINDESIVDENLIVKYYNTNSQYTLSPGDTSYISSGCTINNAVIYHNEGYNTKACANYSHAGGYQSSTSGQTSFIHSNNSIIGLNANNSSILGGYNNIINANVTGSTILGGSNINGVDDDTVYGINANFVTYYGDGSNLTGISGGTSGDYVNLSGDTMTGQLILPSLSATSISADTIYTVKTITNITGLTTLDTFLDTSGDASVWDYVVKSNSGIRSGTITGVWSASTNSVEYFEISTNDIGDTSGVILNVDIDNDYVRLLITPLDGVWTTKINRTLL